MWRSVYTAAVTTPTSRPISLLAGGRAIAFPGQCYNDAVQDWDFHSDRCSVSTFTRVLGYLLIVTTSGLQVPHIVRILKSRRCDGISLLSVALLLHSASANVAYCINRNFPLSAWAESMPLMAQYITLMCLLLLYSGRRRHMLTFVVLYVLIMVPVILGLMPRSVVCALKAMTLPLTFIGKANQLHANYKNSGTGQQSKASFFLLNMRSVGRLMTSLIDTRDTLLVLCYAHACFWNTILTCQMMYYAAHKKRQKRREEKRRRRESVSSGSDSDNDFEFESVNVRRRLNSCSNISRTVTKS